MQEPTRFPLTWPVGWKRTPAARRTGGSFATSVTTEHGRRPRPITVSEACDRLYKELERMAISGGDERVTRDIVLVRYRTLANERHPDKGGSDAAMAELNAARDEALKELGDG